MPAAADSAPGVRPARAAPADERHVPSRGGVHARLAHRVGAARDLARSRSARPRALSPASIDEIGGELAGAPRRPRGGVPVRSLGPRPRVITTFARFTD